MEGAYAARDVSTRIVRVRGGARRSAMARDADSLQRGGGHRAKVAAEPQALREPSPARGAGGLGAPLPVPLIRLEPYFSPGVRYHRYWNAPAGTRKDETNLGWVLGANAGFRAFGVHLAYDSEKFANGTTRGVLGLGASVEINGSRLWVPPTPPSNNS